MRNRPGWRGFLLLLVGAALAGNASAHVLYRDESGVYLIKWYATPITMQVRLPATANLVDGSSQSGSVAAAMLAWNNHLGVVHLSAVNATGTTYGIGNQANEIAMDRTLDGETFPEGALAVTISYQMGDAFVESDIIFNSTYTWNSYRGALRPNVEDIRRVAVHELGHVLGLDHPDEHGQSVTAIMNSRVSTIETPQSDDVQGVQMLYGVSGTVPVNDHFGSATVIAAVQEERTAFQGSNIAATRESGEPGHAGATSTHSVWWRWTAPADGPVTADTLGSDFDTVLAVYTGGAVAALTPIASNDDEESPEQNPTPQRKRSSRVAFDASKGTTYHFAVDGWGDGDHLSAGYTGNITLNLRFVPWLPPAFTRQPLSQTVQAGQFATFVAEVSGRPDPRYQWQRQVPGGEWADLAPGEPFLGANTGTLRVRTEFWMDGDWLRCIATSSVGTTVSSAVRLSVTPLPVPVITAQPRSITLFEAYSGGVYVQATGATRYQWYRDGVLLPEHTDWAEFFQAAEIADSGDYHVVVSNAGGAVTSQVAQIRVKPVVRVSSIQPTGRGALLVRVDGSRWLLGWWRGDNKLLPTPLIQAGEPEVASAAAGSDHDLFVTRDGVLWASGANGFGQLGDGTTNARYLEAVEVARDVVSVAAGRNVSYFIKGDGSLWGMGQNEWGLLGDGSTTHRSVPVRIAGSVRSVSVTYAFALFIKADASLWGMGSNYHGSLGDGTARTVRTTPAKIADDVIAASAGQFCSFFIKRDGTLWGTGGNSLGQLGDGTTADRTTPVLIMADVVSVSAGYDHSLFLKKDGSLWIAGYTGAQFGEVPSTLRMHPIKVETGVASMAAGVNCSYYFKQDGSLWATGVNTDGQLGLGSTSNFEAAPQLVIGSGGEMAPAIVNWSSGQSSTSGGWITLGVTIASRPPPDIHWERNGRPLGGSGGAAFLLQYLQPENTGVYRAQARSASATKVSPPIVVGLVSAQKVEGGGHEVGSNIPHPNGNTFDQVLATGAAEAITADPGQVTRTSFIDLDGDIVQVEFGGPGTLSLVLDGSGVPADPEKYHQPGVQYVKGHAGIVIAGATEKTDVSVFSVGRATAFDPTGEYNILRVPNATDNNPANNRSPLFQGHEATEYDGVADIGFIAILSQNGKFGGLRTANANYFAERGHTGIYAPGVEFTGPVYVGNITAFDAAKPVLVLGSAADVRITGGDLFQENGEAVQVSGVAQLRFADGIDSHGRPLPAQRNRAVLRQDGVDVTSQIIVNP